jgi:hypothetical protein
VQNEKDGKAKGRELKQAQGKECRQLKNEAKRQE